MIRIKDHKQQQLFDPWDFLSPKRRLMLEQGWPGLFREHLLDELPVDQVIPHFKDGFGRPTKELHTVLGVLLLQQTMDLNDEQTVHQLSFNIQWHYALNITEESDEAKYISEKTLWSMRRLMVEHNLDEVMFERLTDKLAKVFDVDTTNQRIDSVHIRSNMRQLGRITIFSRTISKFLVNLKRHHRHLFDQVDSGLIDRYGDKKSLAAFSLVKPTESEKTLKVVSADLFDLIEQFKDQPSVCSMHSYKLMERVLADQCHLETDDLGAGKVEVKKASEIKANSLQNPSDPDATYSGHKGQGYQVQIMETYSRDKDEFEKEPALNLITHVEVQAACQSDAQALVPAIVDTRLRGLGPDELVADTLYGSDENHRIAEAAHVKLVAPTRKGSETRPLSAFKFDDEGYVTFCPAGHQPKQHQLTGKGTVIAVFDLDGCQACQRLPYCPVKLGKRDARLHYNDKQYRLAVRRAAEQSESFTETYRWRAGVEAAMSEYDRLTGVKKLRVRGRGAVRFCAKMKATGLNLLRAARVMLARVRTGAANSGLKRRFCTMFQLIVWGEYAPKADFSYLLVKRDCVAANRYKMAA